MNEMDDKNEKLMKKIDELVEKINKSIENISKEESMVKRYQYVIKCKMLMTKLDRDKKLAEAKENFKRQKEENGITAREEKVVVRDRILGLNKMIHETEEKIKLNSEYDIESSKFIFTKEEVRKSGGIYEYVQELKNSGNPEQVEIAEKIQENIVKKGELKRLQQQLKEQKKELKENQKSLKNVTKNLNNQNNKLSVEETALVLNNKFNIFDKIRNLVGSVTSGVKEFFAEVRENKKADKEKIEALNSMQCGYLEEQEEIRRVYEEKMQKLKESYKEFGEFTMNYYEDKKYNNSKSRKSGQVSKFQEQMNRMKKYDVIVDENQQDNKSEETILENKEQESMQSFMDDFNKKLERKQSYSDLVSDSDIERDDDRG